jgi:ribosomal protein S18 acetylase RimI-like enzyme
MKQFGLRVDLDLGSEHPTARIYQGDLPIGYAFIDVDGDQAELVDILIYDRAPHPNALFHFLGARMNYRRKGFGSIFLREIVTRLGAAGVRHLWGQIEGGDYLPRWYRSIGFTVDELTHQIRMEIPARMYQAKTPG